MTRLRGLAGVDAAVAAAELDEDIACETPWNWWIDSAAGTSVRRMRAAKGWESSLVATAQHYARRIRWVEPDSTSGVVGAVNGGR